MQVVQKQRSGPRTIKINNRSCQPQWEQLDGANWKMPKVAQGEKGVFQVQKDYF